MDDIALNWFLHSCLEKVLTSEEFKNLFSQVRGVKTMPFDWTKKYRNKITKLSLRILADDIIVDDVRFVVGAYPGVLGAHFFFYDTGYEYDLSNPGDINDLNYNLEKVIETSRDFWVDVHRNPDTDELYCGSYFTAKELAKASSRCLSHYIRTQKITITSEED